MTTPPLDLTALREIAKAATPGPWTWNSTPIDTVSGEGGENCIDAGAMAITSDACTDEDAAHIEAFDPPTALALLDELDKAKRACQTMGRVIDRQCEDALQATDSQDLLWGDDGDGDWGAIWERVLGLGEKARAATARAEAAERDLAAVTVSRDGWQTRAEAAEKAVAAVRELHKPVEVYEYDDMNGVFVTDADGEQVALATLCGMCTSASVMEDVGDCEYDASGNFDEVQYPCPTITALDGGA